MKFTVALVHLSVFHSDDVTPSYLSHGWVLLSQSHDDDAISLSDTALSPRGE